MRWRRRRRLRPNILPGHAVFGVHRGAAGFREEELRAADALARQHEALGAAVEIAYAAGHHQKAEELEERIARIEEQLMGLLVAMEDESFDDAGEQAGLERELAALYGTYERYQRTGDEWAWPYGDATLARMARSIVSTYSPEAAERATGRQLEEAARDAWERYQWLLSGYRGER